MSNKTQPSPKNSPTGQTKPSEAKSNPAKPAAPPPPPGPPPHVPPLFRGMDWLSFIVTTLAVFIGYWWTLAPDVTLEDSGELAVASMYAGVPHPPGYPVWTIYTWLFTVLVPVSNIAYRVALASAFAGAFSCGLIALMVSRGSSMFIEGITEFKNLERKWENALCVVSGFVAGMLYGFNGFMWSQSVIVEVYTLSVLSMVIVMVCLLRWIYAPHQHRYLYAAFFWFGITFNNHQSLLVLAIGLEVAITAAQPRMGRELWFWNTLIYIGGLVGKEMGLITTLNENTPLLLVYHMVGLGSAVAWIVLAVKTKINGVDIARTVALAAAFAYVAALLMAVTRYTTVFHKVDLVSWKWGPFVLFNLVGIGVIVALAYLIKIAWKHGKEWLYALGCGFAWAIGAAFYFYMPLAGMSNPPLNWGYPRTVAGFFHAFTRGQYERINPTFGHNFPADVFKEFGRYLDQIQMYIGGALEEFNLIYIVIGLVPFLFLKRMQKRERAWLIGLGAIYLCLSLFLLNLLNPAPDRQSRDLNRVFFTASHVMIAMGIGYGLTLIGAMLATQYERFRRPLLIGAAVASGIALFCTVIVFQSTEAIVIRHQLFDLVPSFDKVTRAASLTGLILILAGLGVLALARSRAPLLPLLVIFGLMPLRSIFSHWSDNEQRGHLFGFWFGHDMFTPAPEFKGSDGKPLYPNMAKDTVLFGGTDPGRFNPTYMIFCESFIPPSKRRDPDFDRRDVYLITQNALADGTYLQYIRAHYNRSAQEDPYFFSELLRGPKERELNLHTNIIARMMLPIDRIFYNLGDRIEKKRRAGTSFFKDTDFTDLAGFAAKLRPSSQQDPLSKYLYEHLSKETQQLLKTSGQDDALRDALVKDLNRRLENELRERRELDLDLTNIFRAHPDPATQEAKQKERIERYRREQHQLFSTERFTHVKLSEYVTRFIDQNPNSHTLIRLNRLLLEEAYPTEIAKSPGGVYPDREILTPTNDDSQRCFQEYITDAERRMRAGQLRPMEDVKIIGGRVQVSGQIAVMAINGLLTKVIFDKNPNNEFYVEESFPLDWMYPHLTPFGIIMKINREPLQELSEDIVRRDHEFWSQYLTRMIGNWITYDTTVSNVCAFAEKIYIRRNYADFKGQPKFIRDSDGQKAFSKLRSSIAGVYAWRLQNAMGQLQQLQQQMAQPGKSPLEQQQLLTNQVRLQAEHARMLKEAEFAFKQAYALCPYSPEAIFRYINLLATMGRLDEALLMVNTSIKLDPFNGQLENLRSELMRYKRGQAGSAPRFEPVNRIVGIPQTIELPLELLSGPQQAAIKGSAGAYTLRDLAPIEEVQTTPSQSRTAWGARQFAFTALGENGWLWLVPAGALGP
jgi:hypothetical protein